MSKFKRALVKHGSMFDDLRRKHSIWKRTKGSSHGFVSACMSSPNWAFDKRRSFLIGRKAVYIASLKIVDMNYLLQELKSVYTMLIVFFPDLQLKLYFTAFLSTSFFNDIS